MASTSAAMLTTTLPTMMKRTSPQQRGRQPVMMPSASSSKGTPVKSTTTNRTTTTTTPTTTPTATHFSSDDDADVDARRAGGGAGAAAAAVALSAAIMTLGGGVQSASAETIKDLYVAAGNAAFLEREFIDLKDVVPGTAGLAGGSSSDDTPVQAVKVTYDADRISHEVLMRTYWKHADPTRSDGQFKEIGPQYRGVVWAGGPWGQDYRVH